MKLTNAIGSIYDITFAIRTSFLPTLTAIFVDPFLLIRWNQFSKVFMANLWVEFGNGVDQKSKVEKERLLTTAGNIPEGVVLDLGAGHGHTVKYLDRARVKIYVALEPNVLMHPFIRRTANEAGYSESDGSLVILPCGAEDVSCILSTLSSAGISSKPQQQQQPVDTIISILTLCTVPNPRDTLHRLVRDVLKPGGFLLVFEHVLNPREDVRWWQRLWAPFWAFFFDSCRMDRDTDVILKSLEVDNTNGDGTKENVWKEWKTWGWAGESEECLFWHTSGRFVKK